MKTDRAATDLHGILFIYCKPLCEAPWHYPYGGRGRGEEKEVAGVLFGWGVDGSGIGAGVYVTSC